MGLPWSAEGPGAHPQRAPGVVGAGAPGRSKQPERLGSQALLGTNGSQHMLCLIFHLQGAAATLQSLLLLQEHLGFAFCLY